jgi:hypothetical protein
VQWLGGDPPVMALPITADPDRPWRGEHEAPLAAPGRGWLGQGLVFEVPELVAAVRYARAALI